MERCGHVRSGMRDCVRSPNERRVFAWSELGPNHCSSTRASLAASSARPSDRAELEVSLTPAEAKAPSPKARRLQKISKRTTSWGACLLRPQDVGVGSRRRRLVDLLVVCALHNDTSRTETRFLSSQFELFGPPRVLRIPSDNTGFRAHGCQAPFRRSPARRLSAVEGSSSRGVPSGTSPYGPCGRERLESCSLPKAAARRRRDTSQDGLGVRGLGTRVRLDRQSTAHNRLLRVSKFRDPAACSGLRSGAWKQVAPVGFGAGLPPLQCNGARDHSRDHSRDRSRESLDRWHQRQRPSGRRPRIKALRLVAHGGARIEDRADRWGSRSVRTCRY